MLTITFSLLLAQPAQPPRATLVMGDGSTVRVAFEQQAIELATKYGTLTIPTADLRRVDLAHRLPPDLAAKVKAALADLGHTDFRKREDAEKALVAIGADAWPSLQDSIKTSKDPEVVKRAATALARIETTLGYRPSFSTVDTVATAETTISGMLTGTTIKVRSKHFGAVEVKLADVRSVRFFSTATMVDVDAGKIGQDEHCWIDSGIAVTAGDIIKLSASGTIDLWPQAPGQWTVGPSGGHNVGKGGWPAGALLGRVGDGKPFTIGVRARETAAIAGPLRFHVVVGPWNVASSGSYRVRVEVE